MLLLALAAVVAGARTYRAIGDWVADLDPAQRALFGCRPWGTTARIPSAPTLRRVLQQVDPAAVDTVLTTWLTGEAQRLGAVAVDGKTLRGSAVAGGRPQHVLAAFLQGAGTVVRQIPVATKTHEIPGLPTL